MDIYGIAALATSMAQERLGQAIAVAVLKTALEVEASTGAGLLDAIQLPTAPNLPPHLGQHVDTTA